MKPIAAEFFKQLQLTADSLREPDPGDSAEVTAKREQVLPAASRVRIATALALAQKALDEWDAATEATNRQRAKHLDAIAVGLGSIAVSGAAMSLERAFWQAIREVAGQAKFLLIRQFTI